MPQFSPGESKTARSPIIVQPAGLSCQAELFLGPDDVTKVATSGLVPFTSTGASQDVNLPVTMPLTEGNFHVYADIYAEGLLIAAYTAIEDVAIVSVPVGIYTCVYCQSTFSTETALIDHMEANHPGKPYLVYAHLPEATVHRGDSFIANVKVFTPGGKAWKYMLRFWGTYGSHADCAGAFGVSSSDEGFYTGEIGLPTSYWDPNTRRIENIPAGTYPIYSRCYYVSGDPPAAHTVWSDVDIGLTVTVV